MTAPLARERRPLSEARRAELLALHWYYTAELAPGVWTPGRGHLNVVATREILRRADVAGARCLDIGTQEGLHPILLARRGAAEVIATDVHDKRERIDALAAVHGVGYEYWPHLPLARILAALDDRRRYRQLNVSEAWPRTGFDLTVMSGLLYHVHSPLHLIGLARSTLRAGGLFVLETAASTDDGLAMRWNFEGTRWIYPGGTNTWFPTLKFLDHALRLFCLAPIDCVHLPPHDGVTRVAIACRAVDAMVVCGSEGDGMREQALHVDYNRMLDRGWVDDSPSTIAYAPGRPALRADSGTCDVYASVQAQAPLALDPARARLALDDRD